MASQELLCSVEFIIEQKIYQWRGTHIERERFNKMGLIFFTEQEKSELKFTEDDKKKHDNWL